jgi:peptidyl-prolyl cis-trans isomerase C
MKRAILGILLGCLIGIAIWRSISPQPSQDDTATFQPDLDEAQQSEWESWKKQFEKGESDRQTRLQWQGRSEASQKQIIRDQLKAEALLERHLAEQSPPITEAQARAWYQEHAEQLRVPERYRVAHLFLSKHDPQKTNRATEIKALDDKLSQGQATFADLTAKHSEDSRTKSHGGDLGWLSSARMPQDLMQAIRVLREGETSPPIETHLGWHILYLTARSPSRLPTFEEVREEIIAMLDQQRRERDLVNLDTH